MNNDIETITEFLIDQMDGAQVPPHDSAELQQLHASVKRVLGAGDARLHLLASQVIGVVVDRVRSSLAAGAVIANFQRGGSDDR